MERFYAEFVLREAINRLDSQRDGIIAALHANSVYDEHKEAKRDEAIQNVERHFDDIIEFLRARAAGEIDEFADNPEDDYDENNPFWAAAKRGWEQLEVPRSDEGDEGVTAGQAVEGENAQRELKEMLSNLDQS